MKKLSAWFVVVSSLMLSGCGGVTPVKQLADCATLLSHGLRPIAGERTERFLGKVKEETASCRGGEKAVAYRKYPWIDWQNYWATADASSFAPGTHEVGTSLLGPNSMGINGSLMDLEYQRMEMIKFNLFDNSGTYEAYITGRGGRDGPTLKVWDEMRLPPGHPQYAAVGGAGQQLCQGDLIRFRNLTGICTDIKNPLMGSTHMPFARNVQFEATFPDLGKNELARNHNGNRLGVLKPDPQLIARTLFTRKQSDPARCNDGQGLPGDSADANCDYKKAPFFNVLAAFWIQFMTHDWFNHLQEGHNRDEQMGMGCKTKQVDGREVELTPEEIAKLGCRPGDRIDQPYYAQTTDPDTFTHQGKTHPTRAYRTTDNNVTAWWDASQLYGFDETSRQRVKRDPKDRAKLLLVKAGTRPGAGEAQGYLPPFAANDPINPLWVNQEATGFPDNWTVGLSFYHNLFAREHNQFVEAFRKQAKATPNADCGLRNPSNPDKAIRYRDVTPDELFEIARLVVAAEIAKIHTTEWTPQLLYDEPLYLGMNANWNGLFQNNKLAAAALEQIVVNNFGKSPDAKKANQWYSVFASGPGIFGLGSKVYKDDAIFAKYDPASTDIWSLKNPDHVNGGINHFGSPFNFPEEFISVYRLHPLVPDLIEYREWNDNPNAIRKKIPVVETLRGNATEAMHGKGLANWAVSMGRQRLGLLTLENQPAFLQNLSMPRIQSETGKIDVTALDLIRDRQRGVPRFNEFRRQYGLRQLASFDDFIDPKLPADSSARADQQRLVGELRQIYGTHRCDASKIITSAQLNEDGSPINDCLGHPNGSMVDNIEDVDNMVGWLSEFARPHGFAISETQFQVFILNASRRIFSDRFFTSSFRPEFYTTMGRDWVVNNGPDGKVMENGKPNGHEVDVSPLKRVLLRTMPELKPQLENVVNAFDPWARDRDSYYSLQWKAQPDAQSDPSFAPGQ